MKHAEPADTYIVPVILEKINTALQGKRGTLLDMGCGDGYAADQYKKAGYQVRAFDAGADDIKLAQSRYPGIPYEVRSIYDENLTAVYGTEHDCIASLEVIEHLYYPRQLFEQSYRLLRKGGWLILSTPYHGYLKNLALSIVNGWDGHFKVDWDGGHIKFFSNAALAKMAEEVGFRNPQFSGVGRVPFLWKSTILLVQK
jgi:2-polyprenyl-6-hydroxyphenyl methylase/3-demethylubiquinone-9 3-methyltransferase